MLDNFKIAKGMQIIKKECIGTGGQCDIACCLYNEEEHKCKLATSEMGEPREWVVGVEVQPLYTKPFEEK